MPQTRSSSRLSGASEADQKNDAGNGSSPAAKSTKRKADAPSVTPTKQGKKGAPRKKQKTIEDTLPKKDEDEGQGPQNEGDVPKDIEMHDAADGGEGTDKPVTETESRSFSANPGVM